MRQDGTDRVVVELPGYVDIATAKSLLGSRGELVMLDTRGEQVPVGTTILKNGDDIFPVVFTGTQLDQSQISSGINPQDGESLVTFGFAGGAKQAFGEYSRTNTGNYLTIALDGIVIESAVIESEIDGQGADFRTSKPDCGAHTRRATEVGPVAAPTLTRQRRASQADEVERHTKDEARARCSTHLIDSLRTKAG